MNVFLHEDFRLVTRNGLKSIRRLSGTEEILMVNHIGTPVFDRAVIRESSVSGMYVSFDTSLGELKIASGCEIFHTKGRIDTSIPAHAAKKVLENTRRWIPIHAYPKYTGLSFETVQDMYWHALTNSPSAEWVKKIGAYVVRAKGTVRAEWLKTFGERYLDGKGIKWSIARMQHNIHGMLIYGHNPAPLTDMEFPFMLSTEQAKRFLEVFYLFSTVVGGWKKDNYEFRVAKKVFPAIVAIASVAMMRVTILEETKDDVSIIISESDSLRFDIRKITTKQNESLNKALFIPEGYMGFYTFWGNTMIIQKEMNTV